MSNSITNLDNILASQSYKEVTANAFFDAASPASVYGRRQSTCSGLSWGYYGGNVIVGGAPYNVANGVLTLSANSTVYVEASQSTGAVTQNNTGWTPGTSPLYQIVTGPTSVTSYTDMRVQRANLCPIASMTITGASAFQNTESNARIVLLGGTPAADFALTIPARPWIYTIKNATGKIATISTGTTPTVAIATGKIAQIMTDGTDVFRVTADI